MMPDHTPFRRSVPSPPFSAGTIPTSPDIPATTATGYSEAAATTLVCASGSAPCPHQQQLQRTSSHAASLQQQLQEGKRQKAALEEQLQAAAAAHKKQLAQAAAAHERQAKDLSGQLDQMRSEGERLKKEAEIIKKELDQARAQLQREREDIRRAKTASAQQMQQLADAKARVKLCEMEIERLKVSSSQ